MKQVLGSTEAGDDPLEHPSYGVVSVSRISGDAHLFGSPFAHQHYMSLRISRAQQYRSNSNTGYTNRGGALIEIALSEAQWARLLSSVGQAAGVPCTLRRIGAERMPECPRQPEVERFHDDLAQVVADGTAALNEALAWAKALVESKGATKLERKRVLDALQAAARELQQNVPFVVQQLHERMDVIVNDAKMEVEAHVQRTVAQAGLEQTAAPLQLPLPKKEGGES